jgi:hypothetical protein
MMLNSRHKRLIQTHTDGRDAATAAAAAAAGDSNQATGRSLSVVVRLSRVDDATDFSLRREMKTLTTR